jgi:hypothetical protein
MMNERFLGRNLASLDRQHRRRSVSADAATIVPLLGCNENADLVSCRAITSLLLVTVMELAFTLVKRRGLPYVTVFDRNH